MEHRNRSALARHGNHHTTLLHALLHPAGIPDSCSRLPERGGGHTEPDGAQALTLLSPLRLRLGSNGVSLHGAFQRDLALHFCQSLALVT
jgi:hypothetical protein